MIIPKSLISACLLLGSITFSLAETMSKETPLTGKSMAQVGVVVADIHKAAEAYAKLFGIETPGVIQAENPEDNPTRYHGELTEASCLLSFIYLDNITLELIQPIGRPSIWMEFLEATDGKGGIHHIAFELKGMDGKIQKLKLFDMQMVQRGGWDGGQYSYLQGNEDLGNILFELLEKFED